MKKNVWGVLLTAAMMASLTAGCASKSSTNDAKSTAAAESKSGQAATEAAAKGKEDMTVYMVAKGFQSQYWQAVYKGAQKAAGELGVHLEFQGPDSESDIAQQVQMMNNAVQMKPAAIGLAALDVSALNDSIKSSQDAKIPIVGFDSGVPDAPKGAVVANAATDNYKAGEVAAENTYPLIKDLIAKSTTSVRIGVLNQDATSESIISRGLGFIDKITELIKADGKTVCITGNDKFVTDSKTDKGNSANVILDVAVPSKVEASLMTTDAQTILNKEDTICIFASNQKTGEGLITGDENLGRLGKDVIGVAFDSGTMIKDAIKSGKLAGAVTQAPVEIGYQTVKLAVAAAKGEAVTDADTGSQWYNKDNMDSSEISQNLYD
ncbi:MAG: LacI family transcriptional regulator [Lacrimispora sp.]|jgi:ribose transport system substrate-binding protein|nr:LacI family transcriptional regulator [Lacrimispora sp.]